MTLQLSHQYCDPCEVCISIYTAKRTCPRCSTGVSSPSKFACILQVTVGAIQAKSVKSVCLKNLMDVCAGGVGYFLFGYAFAYGDPQSCDETGTCTSTGNPFIGSKMFALHNLPETSYQVYYFQFVVSLLTLLHAHTYTDTEVPCMHVTSQLLRLLQLDMFH